MTGLDLLLLVALGTAAGLWWAGDRPWAGWLGVALYALQLVVVIGLTPTLGAEQVSASVSFWIFGQQVQWSLSAFGWFFALLTVGTALFCVWYSAGEWGRREPHLRLFHTALALNVFSMLILLSSADLLSLFIGWELVSWASYLIMTQRGGAAADAAFRYLMYAMAGAMAILLAIVLIYVQVGSLGFEALKESLPNLSNGTLGLAIALFAAGFGVKMALVPFHLWQAEAYAETPGPATAFVSAISARMGLFALLVVLMQLVGLERLNSLAVPFTFWNAREALAWLAAITMVVPTYIALTQNDARMLLAWHGIGQGGYMLLGVLVGTPMGVAGGLMHVFNYATYQAPLFLVVTAVFYRTGTVDLDRLGGLITRMPISYVTLLLGIIGLAGLPPMNGFVSKWLIYKSLLDEGMALLFIAAVVGTLGTILSVYKLIHNIFLGQLRSEHQSVVEVPWSMSAPMLLMAAIAFLTGFMPGLALDLVSVAQPLLGVAVLPHHLGGVQWATGSLDMLWVVGAMLGAMTFSALLFYGLGNRAQPVGQLDNYAGGHFLAADIRYHYSHDFYAGLMRVIGPLYRGSVAWAEQGLVRLTGLLSTAMHGLYRAAYTPLYVLVAAVLALWWMVGA